MTTAISLPRSCGWLATFLDTIKRQRSILIFSIILMLSAPLYILLEASIEPLFRSHYRMSSFLLVLFVAVPMILSVVVPFLVFNYLLNRRAVDLFHALPVKRTSLFLGKYLAGLVMVLLPCVIGYGLAGITMLFTGVNTDFNRVLSRVLPSVLMIYTFVVFMVVCCGTVWETLLYGVGLSVALIGICYSVPAFMQQLYGFSNSNDLTDWLFAFTPFYFLFEGISVWDYKIIFPILLTIGLFCLSLFLYQNRKSENTGSAFSFRFLFHLVSVFITVSLIFTLYMLSADAISALIFGFIAYFVMSVIANRGFKRLMPVFGRGVCIILVSFGFIYTFQYTGGFGYEGRVPSLEEIQSVAVPRIEVGDCKSYQQYNSYEFVSDINGMSGWRLLNSKTQGYQRPENIELLQKLHQNLILNQKTATPEEKRIYVNLSLKYQLKNGGKLERSYQWMTKADLEILRKINQTEEFLQLKYPFLAEGYEYSSQAKVAIMDPFLGETVYEDVNITANEIAAALKKDILARPLGFEVTPNADYIGKLAIYEKKKPGGNDRGTSLIEAQMKKVTFVNVYECDQNVLTLLENRGKLVSFRQRVTYAASNQPIYILPAEKMDWMNTEEEKKGKHASGCVNHTEQYLVKGDTDRAFLLQHFQPVYYTDAPGQLILFQGYSYLIPEAYQKEYEAIFSRAEPVTIY